MNSEKGQENTKHSRKFVPEERHCTVTPRVQLQDNENNIQQYCMIPETVETREGINAESRKEGEDITRWQHRQRAGKYTEKGKRNT